MSEFGKSATTHGYPRFKATNVSPQSQRVDHGNRDIQYKNEQVTNRPSTVVRNHLHGSDVFIRNPLSNTETTTVPKLQRSMTPSPSYNDSDYFSASSRGSGMTTPPFAHTHVMSSDFSQRTGLPQGSECPSKGLQHFTGNHHIRSSSHHFSLPRPLNTVSEKSRTRRRHSSIEMPTYAHRDVNGVHQISHVPSRPQSSVGNTPDQSVSNCLNRHQSYYEAVNNEAVTSQTIFSHSSERIQTLPEEVDTEVTTDNAVCSNSINLEILNQSVADGTHHPSYYYHQQHWDRSLAMDTHEHYPQSDNEVFDSSSGTYPRRRRVNGAQGSPQLTRQIDAAHPRLLNSTNPSSPSQLTRHNSPKHQLLESPVKLSSNQNDQQRHFSYESSHIQQLTGRAFTRSNTVSSSPITDKRIKNKPPPIPAPELNRDECFSDGELGLRRTSTVHTDGGGTPGKVGRRRNKSFNSVASSQASTHGRSGSSRPKSISSHVLQKITKNFGRRGELDNTRVLHVFDENEGRVKAIGSPTPYTGGVESMPIIDGEMTEPFVHRMRINSVGNSLSYQDYQKTQSMELLATKVSNMNGQEAHSLDDLLNEDTVPAKFTAKSNWGSKRKKSISMDPDVFIEATSSGRKNSVDSHEALCKAVIGNNRTQVEHALASGQYDLTLHNVDDLTVLDIAVMLNHSHISHLLMAYGAKESPKFVRNPELRYSHLLQLLATAEEQINKFRTSLSQSSINASTQALEEMTRLKDSWSTKKTMVQHMISVYNNATPPDPPTNVLLDITSTHSLTVRFSEPKKDNGSPVTRYRVEWSKCFDFAAIEGSFVLSDLTYKLSSPDPHSHSFEYAIPDLETGEKYFVRVAASNIKRYGASTYSTPAGAMPCSWHDIDGTEPRYAGSTGKIQTIAMQLKQVIAEYSASKDVGSSNTTGRGRMKRGFSKIFGAALKFHKNLKGGLYLASLMYTDDEKILVTVDDYLPLVEVAESFNSQTIKQDFLWLSKLACTWENVKSMRDNSENYTASSAIQFRNRLLHTITDLQASLGIQDLGLIHPLPYQNSDSLVIVVVKNIKDPRAIQNSSLRWIPQGKLWKKHSVSSISETPSIPDQLISEALSTMDHNTASIKPVSRGLYLGYLKTRSSLAGVKVVVSKQFPNLLPHTKIRDNPHISKDEWSWLTYLHQPKDGLPPYVAMETCCELQKLLTMKVVELLTSRGITSKEEIEQHRLYVNEVVELNENVSFLLLLPPPEQVCTSLGGTDRFEHVSYMGMPFTSFEIAQLYTYQKVFITLYTQVSSTVEMELLIAQHRLREAFSKEETKHGKALQEKLEKFLQETEQVWKNMHWLDSAVQIGRRSDPIHGIPLRALRKNPMTTQSHSRSSSVLSTSSSEQNKPPAHEDYIAEQPKLPAAAQFKKRYSSSLEELKVTPLYDTGLAKGSTVKLHVSPMTLAKEVIQLVVKALEEARNRKQPERPPVISNNPIDFYLLCSFDGSYDEKILDNEFPILELYRESSNFKLFLKKKLESSDYYTTSV